MKQATLEKRQAAWEKQKYFLDKAWGLVANPAGLLIAGFVATNILQHTKIGVVTVEEGGSSPWWSFLPPLWFLPTGPQPTTTKTIPMTVITDDQANALRAGLVTAFAGGTGIIDALKGLFK